MKRLHSIMVSVALFAMLFATVSCERIFDNEPDCSTKIKFVFKKHRQALHTLNGKAADVFDVTVGSVHLFIYDGETGELVLEKFERIENLNSASDLKLGSDEGKCYMSLPLTPGKYRLVAWCGLDENDQNNAFALGTGTRAGGYTECDVKLSGPGYPVNNEKYEALYHGSAEIPEGVINSSSNVVIPVELTKNNNDIAVWVQHAETTFAPGEYEVVYTDANGTMSFEDNSIVRDDKLEYHPYSTSLLTTSSEYNGYPVEAGALVAHISTSRLMEAHKNDAKLEVRNRAGETVFSIPFIQYLLEMQTFTSDGQYYLDCEDTYNCSFYLSGETGFWLPTRIIINNWVRVPDQSDSIGGE